MTKKLKILIPTTVIVIVIVFVFIWTNKKTQEANARLNLQAEMQSKIDDQQSQIDQQRTQIEELMKFNEEQLKKESENTPEKKTVVNNQPVVNNKTNSNPDLDKIKKQQKCQQEINEYNECVSDHNAQMAEYSACLAEHAGERLVPCINPGRFPSCSQPDCMK